MASLPSGSNKILEIQSGNIDVVIKSKRPHPNTVNESFLKQSSKLRVNGRNINGIKVLGEEKTAFYNDGIAASFFNIDTYPLFFEQTDYEIVVKSKDGKAVSVWHENYSIRDKIGPVYDSDDLVSGIVNFGNSAGFSDFVITHDGKEELGINIEVFPSKISYKEDYQNILQDINNEITGVVLDFMRNTYQEFSIGSNMNNIPALFFEIVKQIFSKFEKAANTIISSPHHKLEVEHPIVPSHKVKKIDKHTIKWIGKHPDQVVQTQNGYAAVKAPTVKKSITYNTLENQFTKYILKSTIKKIEDFKRRYIKSTRNPEQSVLIRAESMCGALSKLINFTFLSDVDDYSSTQSMSLVFGMAPGYRELYKYYLMMQRGLSVHGDVFKISMKDTAMLYEYWCFIKLVSLMKHNYKLISPDIIKVDNTGVTITLRKGKKSEVKFINARTGETITLSYNPGEQSSQTINQKPDNVLSLEKRGTDVEYKYVFDAKYRIETNPSDSYYPDANPGPKVDDINTMHRYRDAIVYEKKTPSKFMFEKTMFGAYVLFPYDDPDGEYRNHQFYKSIETVNIGGLPFLPGTTQLVETFLSELIDDSSESAFERATLPRGTEERLFKVDWSVKDVMVGTVRTKEQLDYNIENKCYYAPKRVIDEGSLPISFIALHEEGLGSDSCIKRYAKVITTTVKKRGDIPTPTKSSANELYYYFEVDEWRTLDNPIEIKDSNKGKPRFTNKFLLDNCRQSYQLFSINSEEEYRLMVELDKAFDNFAASDENDAANYKINDTHTVSVVDGKFIIGNTDGEIVKELLISDFGKSPRQYFKEMKEVIE